MREAKIDKDIAYALGGWASDSPDDNAITAENYGRGYKIKTFYEAVASINYPTLNLAHLIQKNR